ncbi:MAG: hypothetical protein WCQ53_02935, partial [bacterium]
DQWKWLYIFIALSFPIRLIHYILLVGESFTFLTVLTLIFEYVLLAYLFLHGEYTDNILYIFFIKGQLSPYYLMALLGIFMSGIWKRDSGLAHILDAGPVSSNIVSKKQFMKKVDEVMHSDPIVNILMLDHKYIKTASIGSICSEIQTGFNPLAITRLSNNSIMVLNDVEQRDLEELDLAYKSRFGVFCMDILSTMISDFPSLIPRSKGHGGLNGSNFIMNQLYPKLRSNINDTIPDLDINSLDKLLSREGIKYRKMSVNMVGDFIETHTAGSKRSNEINELCMLLSKHDLILPDNIILKKDYLGLLPVMHNGELLFIYELENVDINKFRSILRSLLLNEVRGSCGV